MGVNANNAKENEENANVVRNDPLHNRIVYYKESALISNLGSVQ